MKRAYLLLIFLVLAFGCAPSDHSKSLTGGVQVGNGGEKEQQYVAFVHPKYDFSIHYFRHLSLYPPKGDEANGFSIDNSDLTDGHPSIIHFKVHEYEESIDSIITSFNPTESFLDFIEENVVPLGGDERQTYFYEFIPSSSFAVKSQVEVFGILLERYFILTDAYILEANITANPQARGVELITPIIKTFRPQDPGIVSEIIAPAEGAIIGSSMSEGT